MPQVFVATKDHAIEARIHGLQTGQQEAVNRLPRREVPERLIEKAVAVKDLLATPDDQQLAYDAAEFAIVSYVMDAKNMTAAETIRYLNGMARPAA